MTSLRFMAALLVLLAHWNVTAHHVPAMFGAAGVEFFFILSGFILTHVYLGDFKCSATLNCLRSFWLARFARIYPMHILTMVAVAALGLAKVRPELYGVAIGSQLLLIQSWIPVDNVPFAFNGPAWAISDEAFFYVVFPFALLLLRRARLSIAKLFLTIAGVWLVTARFDLSADASQTALQWLIYICPLPRLADFLCGMMLGIAFEQSSIRLTVAVATITETISIASVIIGIFISAFLPLAYGFATCMLPAWAFLIFTFAMQRGSISRMLSTRPLIALGDASFALYMVQYVVVVRMTGFPALIVALTTALIAHRFYEVPARRAIRAIRLPGCAEVPPLVERMK